MKKLVQNIKKPKVIILEETIQEGYITRDACFHVASQFTH